MDRNGDCATSCPPSANSCMLPSHSQGLGDTFIPETTKLCSQDDPALPRAQTWMQPWKIRHKKVSGIIRAPCRAHWKCHRKYLEFWGWIAVYPWKRELCKTPVCTSDKFLAWSSSNYLRFRFITALLTLPDFCLLFLSVPSPCFLTLLNVCLLSSTCLLPNTFRFVFNTLLMAVIRFHPKDFLQYWEMCTDKIHSVRRPKRRMPRKGSPPALLSCGD